MDNNYNKVEKELKYEENKILIEKIKQLEKELNDEKNENKILDEKIKELEKNLNDEKEKVINLNDNIKLLESSLNNKNSSNDSELQKLLELKNKEIEELKSKLNENSLDNLKPGEKLLSINIISIDKKIENYTINCKNTDTFVRLEEKLYKDFPLYIEKETFFMNRDNKIKRFKSLEENKIENNDVLIIYSNNE